MARGESNVIIKMEQKAEILMKQGVKTENKRSTATGYPFPLMPKGERRKGQHKLQKRCIMKGGA